MKKTNLIFSFLLLFISSACSQNENYPPIQDFDESSFELVKIIDGIDIPWGLAFTDNDSFLEGFEKLTTFRTDIFGKPTGIMKNI